MKERGFEWMKERGFEWMKERGFEWIHTFIQQRLEIYKTGMPSGINEFILE
jgi:hypothetical protein